MKNPYRCMLFVIAILSLGVWQVQAQPTGGRGERGGAGGRMGGGMMVMRSVPVEQILGFLAFDDTVALNVVQLGQVRDALKDIHKERAALFEKLRDSNDREAIMMAVQKLRSQMNQKVTAALDANQIEAYKTYMQNMAERGRRGGEQGRPERGRTRDDN